jgi:hypothetical protein
MPPLSSQEFRPSILFILDFDLSIEEGYRLSVHLRIDIYKRFWYLFDSIDVNYKKFDIIVVNGFDYMGFFFLFEDEPVFHENQELVDVLQDSRVVVDVFDLVEDRRLEGVNCHPDAGGGHVQVPAHEEQELFLGLSACDLEGEGEDALEVFSPGGILLPFDVPQKLYVFLTANRILRLNKDRILAVHKLA